MLFEEEKFKKEAQKEIVRCRPGDWNHACRVVSWVKKIGKGREDLYLLIVAAYIHDLGWKNLISDKRISFDQLRSLEGLANANSEKFTRTFLSRRGFSEEEMQKVIRLISAADKHESTFDDEEIIVDADNLSKLCIDHIKEKYKKEEWTRVCKIFGDEFSSRIKTDLGKDLFPEMLEELKHQIQPE